jgi:hypothetical protein
MRLDTPAVLAKVAGRELPLPVEVGIAVAILAAAIYGVRCLLAAGGSRDGPLVTALICLTILVFAYQQAYSALLLVLPMVALARDDDGLGRARRAAVLGLMLVPFVNYLSTYTVLEHLAVSGWRFAALTSANGVALLAAWGLVLGAALRAGD